MIEFDFSIYNTSSKYVVLFDSYINIVGDSRVKLFENLMINRSTFYRGKEQENIINYSIINKLALHYNMPRATSSLVKEVEKLANKVYNNMYYMIYDFYEEDMYHIDNKINRNVILFPILKLLKLLMLVCNSRDILVQSKETEKLYYEVKEYSAFFEDKLNTVLDIISLIFEGEKTKENVLKRYDNALAYEILCKISYKDNDYIEALYFANKAKEIYSKEMNFKRIISVNRIIISSLLHVGKYEQAYQILKHQKLCVRTFGNDPIDTAVTNMDMYIALLGLEKYETIINMLKNKKPLNTIEYICYLTSLYKANVKEYFQHINNELDNYSSNINDMNLIRLLILYFKSNNEKFFDTLKDDKIYAPILKILENINDQD